MQEFDVQVVEENRYTIRVTAADGEKAKTKALWIVEVGIFDDDTPTSNRRNVIGVGLVNPPARLHLRISPSEKAKVHMQYFDNPDATACSKRSPDGWVEQTSDPVTCGYCLYLQANQGRLGNLPPFHR